MNAPNIVSAQRRYADSVIKQLRMNLTAPEEYVLHEVHLHPKISSKKLLDAAALDRLYGLKPSDVEGAIVQLNKMRFIDLAGEPDPTITLTTDGMYLFIITDLKRLIQK